jgi:hypothetical protein
VKVTASRFEASIRIAAIRQEAIARTAAIARSSAVSAARFHELRAGRGIRPYAAPSRDPRPVQAARYAKETPSTLTRAALVFGVSRDQVELAWERLGYAPRVQT